MQLPVSTKPDALFEQLRNLVMQSDDLKDETDMVILQYRGREETYGIKE